MSPFTSRIKRTDDATDDVGARCFDDDSGSVFALPDKGLLPPVEIATKNSAADRPVGIEPLLRVSGQLAIAVIPKVDQEMRQRGTTDAGGDSGTLPALAQMRMRQPKQSSVLAATAVTIEFRGIPHDLADIPLAVVVLWSGRPSKKCQPATIGGVVLHARQNRQSR